MKSMSPERKMYSMHAQSTGWNDWFTAVQIGVHGDVRESPATESTPFNPCDLYQETKLIAEQKVWEYSQKNGVAVYVVRPISIFVPGDTRMLKLFRMIKKGKFIKIGPCNVFSACLHRRRCRWIHAVPHERRSPG